jgi:hypothetical protein
VPKSAEATLYLGNRARVIDERALRPRGDLRSAELDLERTIGRHARGASY